MSAPVGTRIRPTETERVADEILGMVQRTAVGGGRGDSASLVMHGAYLRAWRRLRTIRRLVGMDVGEDAIILTRSLLSIAARAIFVDIPEESDERERRYRSYAKRHLLDRIHSIESLAAVGVEIDREVLEDDRLQLSSYADAPGFPNDRELLESLNLHIFYSRVYRLSSDYVHFSLGLAIDELRQGPTTFERNEFELAQEALVLAVLTYGLFMQLSEKSVRHGLDGAIRELVTSSSAFEAID